MVLYVIGNVFKLTCPPFLEQFFMEIYRNEKDDNVSMIVVDSKILELENPTKCK